MGRQIRSIAGNFEWPLEKQWPGFLLEPIVCFVCQGSGLHSNGEDYCPTCEGEGNLHPKVEPPSFDHMKPFYPTNEKWEQDAIEHGYKFQIWETTSEGSPVTPLCETQAAAWEALK